MNLRANWDNYIDETIQMTRELSNVEFATPTDRVRSILVESMIRSPRNFPILNTILLQLVLANYVDMPDELLLSELKSFLKTYGYDENNYTELVLDLNNLQEIINAFYASMRTKYA